MRIFSYLFALIAAITFFAVLAGHYHQIAIFIIALVMYLTTKSHEQTTTNGRNH